MSKVLYNSLGVSAVGIASYFWGKSGSNVPAGDTNVKTPTPPTGVAPVGSGTGAVGGSFDPALIRPQDFYKYGFPGPVHDLTTRGEFVSCYDRATRNPYWVVEHITQELIRRGEGVDRSKSVFKEDETIPLKFRNRLRDFFRSGYDRGHNAPAADAKYIQLAMDETFYLTNISPQVGEGFNRDYWAHLEDFGRRLTKSYDDVRIMTGPLYLPKKCADGKYRVEYEVIGSPPNIAVPTHFFKLIVGENKRDQGQKISYAAFVLPNDKIENLTPLTSFQVPLEALEKSSGLELLGKVPYYNKKDLCQEVKCEIIVREFLPQTQKVLALPGK
ncbi:nuclease [Scheffersomyces spartinae]|uniref:Nuclease n=1 Tax=Scheffersomyces spartinae TaxID=45513 RepID=A0A9P7VDQ9_9ASCO|nr:nuclease [Scheffersomyces spartinae]KAG7195974.1 nuclease [Scheffersomyces spartinae]